jgi:hypothetical protein
MIESETAYIIDAVVYALFFVALLVRLWQSRVRAYAHYAISILLLFFTDVFLIKQLFGDHTFTYVLMLGQIASLFLAKTTVSITRTWITSMQPPKEETGVVQHVSPQILQRARWISLVVWIAFTVFSMLGAVFFLLRITTGLGKEYTYISGAGFVVSTVALILLCVWLFLRTPAECTDKKHQMVRLMVLAILVSVPVIVYSTTDDHIISNAVYWILAAILLVPRHALIGYDKPPEQVNLVTV